METSDETLWKYDLNETVMLLRFNTSILNNISAIPEEYDATGADCARIAGFIIHGFATGVLIVIGLICNTISWLVLRKDTDSLIASWQLQALAIADNAVVAFWIVQFFLPNSMPSTYNNSQANLHIIVYTHPLIRAAQMASIWLTVLIAVTRYVAVCHPLRASYLLTVKRNRKAVIGIALCSLLYNMPRFFEYKVVTIVEDNISQHVVHASWLRNNKIYTLLYFDIMKYIFIFVLPLFLLIILNTRLVVAYRQVQRQRARMVTSVDSHDNNLTLVMILVILVFTLCHLPSCLVKMVWKFVWHPCPSFPFFLTNLSQTLQLLNCCTNFFIYCVFRKKFRKMLVHVLCRKNQARKHSTEVAMLSDCMVP